VKRHSNTPLFACRGTSSYRQTERDK
jgi:hypothetical protein